MWHKVVNLISLCIHARRECVADALQCCRLCVPRALVAAITFGVETIGVMTNSLVSTFFVLFYLQHSSPTRCFFAAGCAVSLWSRCRRTGSPMLKKSKLTRANMIEKKIEKIRQGPPAKSRGSVLTLGFCVTVWQWGFSGLDLWYLRHGCSLVEPFTSRLRTPDAHLRWGSEHEPTTNIVRYRAPTRSAEWTALVIAKQDKGRQASESAVAKYERSFSSV